MFNPFTYIRDKIRAYPVNSALITGAAALFLGWGVPKTYNYFTRVPEAKLGVLTGDVVQDMNGDTFNDFIMQREDGYQYLLLGDGTGVHFQGIAGVVKDYRDLE